MAQSVKQNHCLDRPILESHNFNTDRTFRFKLTYTNPASGRPDDFPNVMLNSSVNQNRLLGSSK